tara:strand:+ start:120 stop:407 length:288 start_codon:yes stop_codon:yes gene_type:complete
MKKYSVQVLKSDNLFKVKAEWKKSHDLGSQVDTFSNEKDALDHASYWTNESSKMDYIQSVQVSQIIRHVVAKEDDYYDDLVDCTDEMTGGNPFIN